MIKKSQGLELDNLMQNYNENKLQLLSDKENTNFTNNLISHNLLIKNQYGKLKKTSSKKIYQGILSVKSKFGFVITSVGDFYIGDVKGYIDGDQVVIIARKKEDNKSQEASILYLLKRNKTEVLGFINCFGKINIVQSKQFEAYSLSVDSKVNFKKYLNNYLLLDIVKVRGYKIDVNLKEVVANSNDPDLKMKLVLSEFNLKTEFTDQQIKEAMLISETDVTQQENRRDLTNEQFITIDGSDAKDLDDAVLLKKEKNGYRLFVSIADVSYYIQEGSKLDQEALERSTSIYFIDRVVPMLPKEISNGICSLHPNVNRYTLTAEMVINKQGKVIESEIYPSIINSKFRMTYDDVNEIVINQNPKIIEKFQTITETLCDMNKLAKVLNNNRLKRGSFNLADKEPVFKFDINGNIIGISARERKDSEKLIEEFMIIANETVASTIFNMNLPFIYRVHGQPNPDKLKDLFKLFPLFDVQLKGNVEEFHSSSFKVALDQVNDPIDKRILSDSIIRSLQKAFYSTNNIGHFGLASPMYTHFTSPIRRYPDLIVHRMLRKYLFDQKKLVHQEVVADLNYICKVASVQEVQAFKAEKKIEDQKIAEYMKQFIGNKFIGKVSSITNFGFFVELETTQRGLIRFNQLDGHQEVVNFQINFQNKQKIKLGDTIRVKLINADSVRGEIDFEPLDFKLKEGTKYEDDRSKQKSSTRLRSNKKVRSGDSVKRKRNKVNKNGKSKY